MLIKESLCAKQLSMHQTQLIYSFEPHHVGRINLDHCSLSSPFQMTKKQLAFFTAPWVINGLSNNWKWKKPNVHCCILLLYSRCHIFIIWTMEGRDFCVPWVLAWKNEVIKINDTLEDFILRYPRCLGKIGKLDYFMWMKKL